MKKLSEMDKKEITGIAGGVAIAVIGVVLIVVTCTSLFGGGQSKLPDAEMSAASYDTVDYEGNEKAPEDVKVSDPNTEFATAGKEVTIPANENQGDTSDPGSGTSSRTNGSYAAGSYTSVYTNAGDAEPDGPHKSEDDTKADNTTDGDESSPVSSDTNIVRREGNDISDQIWKDDNVTSYNGFTTTDTLADASGKMGTLSIPAIDLSVGVYESLTDEMEAMTKGVAHFAETSGWDGNVGLCAHNWTESGNGAYFKNLDSVKKGDSITYKTSLGTRTYKVMTKEVIDEDNFDYLARTDDNRLTLITCTFSDGSKRLMVQAVAQ